MIFQQTFLESCWHLKVEVSKHLFFCVIQDLGLATSRGRGKCKNPSCSYVYTNRHKPRICPSCGYDLAKGRAEKTAKSLVRFRIVCLLKWLLWGGQASTLVYKCPWEHVNFFFVMVSFSSQIMSY